MLADYAKAHDIPILDIADLPEKYKENELTLGLSCRYSVLIKKPVISLFKNGIINMHGGLVPKFRGPYSCCWTIYEGAEIGGGTLHYIDEGIDTGNIVKRCEISIGKEDTGYIVFQKTQKALYEGMVSIISEALDGVLPTVTIQQLID